MRRRQSLSDNPHEHADESYWKDLDYFHTVAEFSKSKDGGLVPKYIYK